MFSSFATPPTIPLASTLVAAGRSKFQQNGHFFSKGKTSPQQKQATGEPVGAPQTPR